MRMAAVVTRQAQLVRGILPDSRALGSLDALLALPEIELIVIAAPNHRRARWRVCDEVMAR